MAGAEASIRVFVCDDVAELRELVRVRLEAGGGIQIVGEAGDGPAGVAGVSATQPDVVILDLSLPGMDGLEALPLMKRAVPSVRVIIFSGFARARVAQTVAELGADRYIEKGEPLAALRQAVVELAGRDSGDPH